MNRRELMAAVLGLIVAPKPKPDVPVLTPVTMTPRLLVVELAALPWMSVNECRRIANLESSHG